MKAALILATISLLALLMVPGSPAQNKDPGAPSAANQTTVKTGAQTKKIFVPLTMPIEVVGEVVDAWCYSSQVMGPGRGEGHKACGLACAHGGVTMGIVDDKGTLYIAAKHKGFQGCKELLIPFMAKRVKAVGWLAQKGGCNMLKIKTVQEIK